MEKLQGLEQRRTQVEELLSAPPPSPVALYPNLSEIYKRKVTAMAAALADPAIRTQALESIRGLIGSVTVQSGPNGITLELDGAITAMLDLAQPGAAHTINQSSVKVVAGARYAFCLPTSAKSIRLVRKSTPKIRSCWSRE